jgi:hypothetical protein
MPEREHRGGGSFSATRDQAAALSNLAGRLKLLGGDGLGLQGPKIHPERRMVAMGSF